MGAGDAGPMLDDHVFGYLTADNRRRLRLILCEHLPEVFEIDRVIEQKTGYSSEICKNMKNDVLAHLALLAKRQQELDHDQQASQLAKIEEHLRRAIVEHPEEILRGRIVDIEALWIKYLEEAFAYREEEKLHGVPRHEELEELRQRIDVHLETARKTKPDETTWDESLAASAQVTEGADLAADLADKLTQCIGEGKRVREREEADAVAARERDEVQRTDQRRFRINIAVIVLVGLGTVFGAYFLGKDAGSTTVEKRVAPVAHKAVHHSPKSAGR